MRTLRTLGMVGGLLFGAGSLTGCGDIVADRLDAICACEGCSDRRLEELQIGADAQYDVAAAYDCTELLEPYWECQVERHECDENEYKDDNDECGDERREYDECLDARSSRDDGAYRADDNL